MIDLFSIMKDGVFFSVFKLDRIGGILTWIYQTCYYSLGHAQDCYPQAFYIKDRRVDWLDMSFRESDLND